MHIGLIGGIGVAATVVYYQRLAASVDRIGGTLECTIVHANVHDLVRNNLANNRIAQAEIYASLIDRLRAAGADCAAITSLGGHFCYDETLALSSLPLVSAVTPLDAHFASQGLERIGILGTRVVQRTAFYGTLRRTQAVLIDEDVDDIAQTYQDMAVAGQCTHAERAYMFDAGARLVRERGADAIVLGGTDLGLAFDGHDPGYPVIDALDVHVDVLARLATGALSLTELETDA